MIKEDPQSGNQLLGRYRGIVLKHLPHGRCKVYIPGVYPPDFMSSPDMLPSAQPRTPLFAGTNDGNGVFSYPNLSTIVWCEFMNGDANLPTFDSATLGGENAFGQYELIKTKDEDVSDRHMITSGKTHIIWYENGKISAIVEDPIRTHCSVDYDQFELENNNTSVENKYSYTIDNPVEKKIAEDQISNINCQYVLDNSKAHGTLSTSTHWYDIVDIQLSDQQLTSKGAISIDNCHRMDNDGVFEVKTLSTSQLLTTDQKNRYTNNVKSKVENTWKTTIPGKHSESVDLTSNIIYVSTDPSSQISKRETYQGDTKIEYDVSADYDIKSFFKQNTDLVDTTNEQTKTIKSEITNSFELQDTGAAALTSQVIDNVLSADKRNGCTYAKKLNAIASLSNAAGAGSSFITKKDLKLTDVSKEKSLVQTVELTNFIEMTESGSYTSGTKVQETKITGNQSQSVESSKHNGSSDTTHKTDGTCILDAKNYDFRNVNGAISLIDNKSQFSLTNSNDAKAKLIVQGKKSNSGAPLVDSKYSSEICMTTSTADITIIDNISKKQCSDKMDAKFGVTEIKVTNKTSGTHCTIRMDAEGKLTIDTSDQLTITTTNEVNVKTEKTTITSPDVIINGDTKINGDTIINGTLDVSDATSIGSTLKTSGNATIAGISFLGHFHIDGSHGVATSPPR